MLHQSVSQMACLCTENGKVWKLTVSRGYVQYFIGGAVSKLWKIKLLQASVRRNLNCIAFKICFFMKVLIRVMLDIWIWGIFPQKREIRWKDWRGFSSFHVISGNYTTTLFSETIIISRCCKDIKTLEQEEIKEVWRTRLRFSPDNLTAISSVLVITNKLHFYIG